MNLFYKLFIFKKIMGISRIYPDKSNTIASGVYKYLNAGQNAVMELWYGGGEGEDLARRNSISRGLLYFELDDLSQKLDSKIINPQFVTSYKLKMKNTAPRNKVLEPEFDSFKMDKYVAASFDLIFFPINKDWDEGRGYDLVKDDIAVRQLGNPLLTGYSNWQNATSTTTWDSDGIYLNPTASTNCYIYNYSGSVAFQDITATTHSLTAQTLYFFSATSDNGLLEPTSAVTSGNNTFFFFNPLSGTPTTLDFVNTILTGSTFSTLGISLSGGSISNNIISGDSFYLSAYTSYERTRLWFTQHFDLGNEDIDVDITPLVLHWLSGGSENYGIGVAYRRDYELISGYTRYVSTFYTNHTNTAYKPFIEVNYNQVIQDDRTQVANNRTSRLFLYTYSGYNEANYYSACCVNILNSNGSLYAYNLTPLQFSKGVYYIDITMTGTSRGQVFRDVWSGVTFQPGLDVQNYTQNFQIIDDYYSRVPQINDYSLVVYGLEQNKIITNEETIRVYCDLRVNYSQKEPRTAYSLQYRMVMNNQEEVIPWTSANRMVENNCPNNFFVLDTSWLLHNQTYKIQFRISELGTTRLMPEEIDFKVLRPF